MQTPFSPLSFGKSFMKIRSAVPENRCLVFLWRTEKAKKSKKKTKKTSVKHIRIRLIGGCIKNLCMCMLKLQQVTVPLQSSVPVTSLMSSRPVDQYLPPPSDTYWTRTGSDHSYRSAHSHPSTAPYRSWSWSVSLLLTMYNQCHQFPGLHDNSVNSYDRKQ